jgi:hypothetical protein
MTWRDYVCSECHYKKRAGKLLNALKNFRICKQCPICGRAMELLLYFDFGLDIGRTKCRVLDVFLPKRRIGWNDVVFYPFLVVLRRGRTRAYWLPYWHVEAGKEKYGQWAPFMNERSFKDLLLQARQKGYPC